MTHGTREISSHRLDENGINHAGIGMDFIHRPPIDGEMTEMQGTAEMIRQAIAFLLGHKAVDQAGKARVAWRGPGCTGWGEMLLQRLEQQHEIPHREDVMFNEQPQMSDGVNRLGERMTLKIHTQRPNSVSPGKSSGRGPSPQVNRRSSGWIDTSLMLASRRRIRPVSENSQFSLPWERKN